jgi:NAD(P)-dependent dehydrogenase (short-subunit alcohol dehydrogenase family)
MPELKIDLSGKRAVVTGGNRGIGRTIVERLAQAGARVAINYLVQPEDAHALVQDLTIQNGPGAALAIAADISDETQVEALFGQAQQALGGVDILVNNAGIESLYAAIDLPAAEWDRVMDVNLRGAFLCAQAAARRMRDQGSGGVIVNIASIHDRVARLGAAHYCASKAGLTMLTQVLALEWAEYGIRVVGVSPGAIETPERKEIIDRHWRDWFAKWVPLGRFGRTAEVADAVIFLASDQASYITGATLTIDGGYSNNLVRYDARKDPPRIA